MSDLNKVIQIGRLTKDPELRYTQGGASVANFSIAVNRTFTVEGNKKEEVNYFNCICWGKAGEIITQYCKKGNRIGIEGRLQQRSWDDQNGNKRYSVEIVVENFQFLTPKKSGIESMGEEVPPGEVPENPFNDDSIPF
jgi:single-strand DNA-binding protein